MTNTYAHQTLPSRPSSSSYPDHHQQRVASQPDFYPQPQPIPQQRTGGRGSDYIPEQPRYSEPADDLEQYSPDNNDDFYHGNGEYSPQRSLPNSRPPTPPGPILDHSHLRPGKEASLLSHERTLELYRANAKKTQDPELQFEFAVFLVDAAKHWPVPALEPSGVNVLDIEKAQNKRDDLYREATSLLRKLADRGHMPSQYFLADCYANGIGTAKSKQDFDRAFPLFVLAAKHGHPDAAYRAGTCCENGWGCRRETAKALQFFRKAAAALHPGAQYRLGIAELNGELGLSKRPREGVKWLKRSAEHATAEFPHAIHELALLHEKGLDSVIFEDHEYASELLAQASELGYAPSAYRLGECYEYGKMGCPQDPALSIHYYNIAAQQNHRDACFALTSWYLVGSPGVLPQSDTEAYLWGKRAAEAELVKAMYAVGYFLEVGIGTSPDMKEAISWYKRAAEKGDKRASQRLKANSNTPIIQSGGPGSVLRRGPDGDDAGKGGRDKDCIIM